MTSAELYTSLTKDMSKGVNRLMSKQELLKDLSKEDLEQLRMALVDNYSPKSDIGKASKQQVVHYIDLELGIAVMPNTGVSAEEMIESKTCMLKMKVRQPGFNQCINTKMFVQKSKDPAAVVDLDEGAETDPFDYKRHTVVQKLYDKTYTSPTASQKAEFKSWLERHAVRHELMGPGYYLVPRHLINTVIGRIEQFTIERKELVEKFIEQQPSAIDQAKNKLGVHFNIDQYPDEGTIREKFGMMFRWQDVNPAAALKEINRSAYENEVENAKIDFESTYSNIREALRVGFTDLIVGFSESMGNDESGKPKVFHASKVEKLKDFLQTFESRNITQDDELSNLAAQAKELISTVDPKLLRKDFDQRKALADAFTKIREDASKLVEVRSRKLNLDDE